VGKNLAMTAENQATEWIRSRKTAEYSQICRLPACRRKYSAKKLRPVSVASSGTDRRAFQAPFFHDFHNFQKNPTRRVTDSTRFAVKEVKATKMTTIRNTTSNPECTKFVLAAAIRLANAPVKRVCNGFVAVSGGLLDWTLLRHRSSDAVNGVGGRY